MSILTAVLTEATEDELDRLAQMLATRLHPQEQSRSQWLRGADAIAGYIGCPRSRVYALSSAQRIPVEHDGSALIARTSDLDSWLEQGGARRP